MPNELEQSTPAGLILFVDPQMICQLLDAARQDGDLNFRGTGVRIMAMIIRDQFGLNFFRERHDVCFPFFRLCRSPCSQPQSLVFVGEPLNRTSHGRELYQKTKPGFGYTSTWMALPDS